MNEGKLKLEEADRARIAKMMNNKRWSFNGGIFLER